MRDKTAGKTGSELSVYLKDYLSLARPAYINCFWHLFHVGGICTQSLICFALRLQLGWNRTFADRGTADGFFPGYAAGCLFAAFGGPRAFAGAGAFRAALLCNSHLLFFAGRSGVAVLSRAVSNVLWERAFLYGGLWPSLVASFGVCGRGNLLWDPFGYPIVAGAAPFAVGKRNLGREELTGMDDIAAFGRICPTKRSPRKIRSALICGTRLSLPSTSITVMGKSSSGGA